MSFVQFLRENAPFLAAGALLTFSSSFGQTFLISVFAGVIREEFNLSDGDWGQIYGIGTLASGLVMIWAGVLTDYFRVRYLGAVILLLLALACLAMAFAPSAWALPFVIFALRFTGQGMTSHLAIVAMARWFVATRGKALSVATVGYAIGEALMPLFIVFMFDVVDWRWMWIGFAGFLIVMVPVLSYLLRLERTPQSVAEESQSTGMFNRHWTRKEALRHWLFWIMVPAIFGPSAWITALFFQQVHLAETKGWSHAALVSLFPLYTMVAVGTAIASGFIVDRFGSARTIPFVGVPIIFGFVLLGLGDSLTIAAIALCLIAMSHGLNGTFPNVFWAEFYGTKSIGGIKSLATAVMVFGSAFGPWITGALIDFGIPFKDQTYGIAFLFFVTMLIVFFGVRKASPNLPSAA